VVLKVVKRLLDAGVSLPNIRKAIETLRQWGEDDLATMTLISDGTTVYECRSAEEIVDLVLDRTDDAHRVDEAGRADHLLDEHAAGLVEVP